MNHVVCFGEALIDFLAVPATDPGQPPTFAQYAGGAPANAAVAVARLGGRARFVGMLGRDMFGDFLQLSLEQAGVDTRHVLRTGAAKTALAFVSLDAGGERSFDFYRPPSADLLFRQDDFDPQAFAEADLFHVCSNSLTEAGIAAATLHGMHQARAAGALVSFDLNLRPLLWPGDTDPMPRLWQALEAADLVKLAADELAYLCARGDAPDAVIDRLLLHARVVAVTDAAAPLRWYTRTQRGSLPSFRVRAVDTTAAGDAFIGGLLYQLQSHGIRGDNFGTLLDDPHALEEVLRFAAACGALAVTRFGAFASLPTAAEARALLREATA